MLRLKEIRKSRHITQQAMADFLCIERNSYTRYENGQRLPSIDMLIKIADYLNVSLDYLFDRTDNPMIAMDTNKSPSPILQERALELGRSVQSGAATLDPDLSEDELKWLAKYVDTAVNQALDKRGISSGNPSESPDHTDCPDETGI